MQNRDERKVSQRCVDNAAADALSQKHYADRSSGATVDVAGNKRLRPVMRFRGRLSISQRTRYGGDTERDAVLSAQRALCQGSDV